MFLNPGSAWVDYLEDTAQELFTGCGGTAGAPDCEAGATTWPKAPPTQSKTTKTLPWPVQGPPEDK